MSTARMSHHARLRGFPISDKTWDLMYQNHKKKMNEIEARSKQPQAPQRPLTSRSDRSSARRARPIQNHQHPTPRKGGDASATPSAAAAQPKTVVNTRTKMFCIDDLTEEPERNVCLQFVELLKGIKDANQRKELVEDLFIRAEEEILLADYNGVFPALATEKKID